MGDKRDVGFGVVQDDQQVVGVDELCDDIYHALDGCVERKRAGEIASEVRERSEVVTLLFARRLQDDSR